MNGLISRSGQRLVSTLNARFAGCCTLATPTVSNLRLATFRTPLSKMQLASSFSSFSNNTPSARGDSNDEDQVFVEQTRPLSLDLNRRQLKDDGSGSGTNELKREIKAACGTVPEENEEEEEEQEEMFVDAHESFGHNQREWGGPRRGGRFPEPTRYGDWERKGRCSDF